MDDKYLRQDRESEDLGDSQSLQRSLSDQVSLANTPASAGRSSERQTSPVTYIQLNPKPQTPGAPSQADSSERRAGRAPASATAHLAWFSLTVILFLVAWFFGPTLVERFQYAATRGRIKAQYENAAERLQQEPLNNVTLAYQLVAQKIKPSVVSVTTLKWEHSPQANFADIDQHEVDPGMPELHQVASEGSGVVLTEDGFIMTNHHVVRNSRQIHVVLADRRIYEATVIGSDEFTDLAVLKINAKGLIPAEWGDSDEIEVGTLVWAVGNPYGLKQTITAGILSGKDRRGESSHYQEFLQTDAAVNPGNSGGPLVDAHGRVIGINTSIYGQRFQGISFAVPSILAQFIYNEIRDHGEVRRGFLGVVPGVVFQQQAERLNLSDLDGALVRQVSSNTPASQAGIQPGDVIRRWNGHEVKNWRHLYRYVAMTKPAETVPVELIRKGQPVTLEIQVTDNPYERTDEDGAENQYPIR